MTAGGTNRSSHLAVGPQHRYREQLDFLATFPAYTAERAGSRLTLWYRSGRAVHSLVLEPAAGGVAVVGDVTLARRILNADAPPLFVENALPPDPAGHRLLYRRYAGIRPVRFPTAFEGIAWTILGQQISVGFAVRLKERLARRYGRAIAAAGGPLWVFPNPEDVAAASADELRTLQLSGQKAVALLGVARAIASGRWDPQATFAKPTADALDDLRHFHGVGRWTAEYVLLRVAGHPDVLPAGDAGLQRAWGRLTGAPGRVSDRALEQAGMAWQGWRSDFAFYLWLDNVAERRRATEELRPTDMMRRPGQAPTARGRQAPRKP